MRESLGRLFEGLRARAGTFKWLFFAALVGLLALNAFIHPYHPHVAAEKYPGFWAVFGLVLAVGMAAVMKLVIGPILSEDEEVYRERR